MPHHAEEVEQWLIDRNCELRSALHHQDTSMIGHIGVFLVIRPNPILHFAPFLYTHCFPVFELHIQKWVIFVRRRPCVCDTFSFESPTTTIELPECQERRGAKNNIVRVF